MTDSGLAQGCGLGGGVGSFSSGCTVPTPISACLSSMVLGGRLSRSETSGDTTTGGGDEGGVADGVRTSWRGTSGGENLVLGVDISMGPGTETISKH